MTPTASLKSSIRPSRDYAGINLAQSEQPSSPRSSASCAPAQSDAFDVEAQTSPTARADALRITLPVPGTSVRSASSAHSSDPELEYQALPPDLQALYLQYGLALRKTWFKGVEAERMGHALGVIQQIGWHPNPEAPPYVPHSALGKFLQYLLMGAGDGILSIYLFPLGLIGVPGSSGRVILAEMIAAVAAGSISMWVNQFNSTRGDRQVDEGQIEVEKDHLKNHLPMEVAEMFETLAAVVPDVAQRTALITSIASNPKAALALMKTTEFGSVEGHAASPLAAATVNGLSFLACSMATLMPCVLAGVDIVSPSTAIYYLATPLAAGAWLGAAYFKAQETRRGVGITMAEQGAIMAAGAVVCWGIGRGVQQLHG